MPTDTPADPFAAAAERLAGLHARGCVYVGEPNYPCSCGQEARADGIVAALRSEYERGRADGAGEHGTRKYRCICPDCRKMVPSCWVAQMCVACATENCEHSESVRGEREGGQS